MTKDIETLLHQRQAPAPSPDMAARIKEAANRSVPYTPTFFNELFIMFAIPRPKLMLGLSLLAGLLIGVGLDIGTGLTDAPTQDDIMFYMNEGWL